IPLAVLSVIDAVPWRKRTDTTPGPVGRLLPAWLWDRQAGPDARFTRGLIGWLYLVWVLQAFVLQRGLIYVHLPETLLMLALWAAPRGPSAALPLLWIPLTSATWLVADRGPAFRHWLTDDLKAKDVHASATGQEERYLVRHPLADREWMANWPECWRS